MIEIEYPAQEIQKNFTNPSTEKETLHVFQADEVSGVPIADIKTVQVDLDADDIAPEALENLSPDEIALIKAEQEKRRRKSAGPGRSIVKT